MPTQELQEWLTTPLGNYVIEQEQIYFDHAVSDVFGFYAMQYGLPAYDFLKTSRIPFKFSLGMEPGVKLRAEGGYLPVASNSVDLLLLPHALEFADNPHQILREVERVLMPEGQVIISGFNPRSLWGLWRVMDSVRMDYPWRGHFISLPRLKDWLALLGLEVLAGRFTCYAPPFSQERWLRRARFMEAAGDRWWPISGGVYILRAVKRVAGMRVIRPQWANGAATKKGLAPVTQKLSGKGFPRAARSSTEEMDKE